MFGESMADAVAENFFTVFRFSWSSVGPLAPAIHVASSMSTLPIYKDAGEL